MKKISRYCLAITIAFLFLASRFSSQNKISIPRQNENLKSLNKRDSMLNELKNLENKSKGRNAIISDTLKLMAYNALIFDYLDQGEYDKAMEMALKGKLVASNIDVYYNGREYYRTVKKMIANAYNMLGLVQASIGHPNMAIRQYNNAIYLQEKVSHTRGLVNSINNLANIYCEAGNYSKGLDLNFKALKIREQKKDEKGMASSYNNIGNVYQSLNNYEEALRYYKISYEINKRLGVKLSEGRNLNNIGLIYTMQNKDSLALVYLTAGLELRKKINDRTGIASSLSNLGNLCLKNKNYDEALLYNTEALAISLEFKSKPMAARCYLALSELFVRRITETKRHSKYGTLTRNYLDDLEKISRQLKDHDMLNEYYRLSSTLSYEIGDYLKYYNDYKRYITVRDSLVSGESTRKIISAEMNYEFGKTELNRKEELLISEVKAREEHEKQKAVRNLLISGFSFMSILVVLVVIGDRNKRKANRIIESQKLEMEGQTKLAEIKQKQIMDSINYARRIQQSVLKSVEEIRKTWPGIFIINIPKEIVGGDFYWFGKSGKEIFLAVADCTGHGVPGAFLNMVGSTLLNEIVIQNRNSDPAKIVMELSQSLIATLAGTEESVQFSEGMSLTFCKINTDTNLLSYFSVNQPLYLANQKGVTVIRPQMSVYNGLFNLGKSELKSSQVEMEEGSMVYLSTDGYCSQLGGNNYEKFKSRKFEQIMSHASTMSVNEQCEIFTKRFSEWKGKNDQTDDVLMIGLKAKG